MAWVLPRSRVQACSITLTSHKAEVLKRFQRLAAFLWIASAACGNQHPTAPSSPEPPVVVDWEGLGHLYDDPLYRRLAHLIEDEAVAQSLDEEMAALALAIRSQNLTGMKKAMERIHAERVAYAERLGADRHEEPQLHALLLFEIRGAAFINYMHRPDAELTVERADDD